MNILILLIKWHPQLKLKTALNVLQVINQAQIDILYVQILLINLVYKNIIRLQDGMKITHCCKDSGNTIIVNFWKCELALWFKSVMEGSVNETIYDKIEGKK